MPSPLRFRRSRYTDPRPWAPMTDAEWAAILPYLPPEGGRGRPILGGARARLDAVFRVVSGKRPWREAGDTAHRQFRRWARAGVFARLLKVVATSRRAAWVPGALRAMEHWICAAHRRSVRVCGVRAIALARRLGLLSALPGPPWMLPDPVLSERLLRVIAPRVETAGKQRIPAWEFRLWRRFLKFVGGARRIHPSLVPA